MEPERVNSAGNENAEGAEFYLQSPFRNSIFKLITARFIFNIVGGLAILYLGWRSSNTGFIFFICFSLVIMVGWWDLSLRTHEEIRGLFISGQIQKVEKNSAMERILICNKRLILGGFAGVLMLMGYMLTALQHAVLKRYSVRTRRRGLPIHRAYRKRRRGNQQVLQPLKSKADQ